MTVMIHLAGARGPVVPWLMIRSLLDFDDLIVCVFVSLWHHFSARRVEVGDCLDYFSEGSMPVLPLLCFPSSLLSFYGMRLIGSLRSWLEVLAIHYHFRVFHDQILKVSAD